MEFTAKYSGPAGDAVTLETAGGATAAAVSWVSATELSVTVGGSTVNFPFATSALEEWRTVGVSLQEFNGNTVVCLSISRDLDYTTCQTAADTFDGSVNHAIKLGEADQIINNIKFYDTPMSIGTMDRFYVDTADPDGNGAACTAFNGAACNYCRRDDGGATGVCLPTCLDEEYGTGNCLPCDENCKSCFGPEANECFSCVDEVTYDDPVVGTIFKV